MSESVLAALVLAVVTGLGACFASRLIAALPEPVDPAPEGSTRPSYAELAERPRTAVLLGGIGVAVGALVGARLGWHPVLLPWAFLLPVLLILGFIDAHTRLLPTRIIAPSYAVVVLLLLLAGALDGGYDLLVRAAIGWAVLGGLYLLLWLIHPRGIGYGDVRLSGLLGLALGAVGTSQLLIGAYAGFLLGGLGGFALSRLGLVESKRYAFGPWMVVGAVVGLLFGPACAHALGY